jgi:hypothetical protein
MSKNFGDLGTAWLGLDYVEETGNFEKVMTAARDLFITGS